VEEQWSAKRVATASSGRSPPPHSAEKEKRPAGKVSEAEETGRRKRTKRARAAARAIGCVGDAPARRQAAAMAGEELS